MIGILDTHVVLAWFERPSRLSQKQRKLLACNDQRHPVGVADTSLWEIALLVEAGRIRLNTTLDEWLARATAAPHVNVCTLTPQVAAEIVALPATRRWDIADRIILATARVLGIPLVTSDERIIESRLVETIC